jgi:hypothetical protein
MECEFMNLCYKIEWVVFEEHKPLNQEQTKNIRTHSPMYEHDFSLNRKY